VKIENQHFSYIWNQGHVRRVGVGAKFLTADGAPFSGFRKRSRPSCQRGVAHWRTSATPSTFILQPKTVGMLPMACLSLNWTSMSSLRRVNLGLCCASSQIAARTCHLSPVTYVMGFHSSPGTCSHGEPPRPP